MSVSRIDLEKCIGCGTCVVSCPMDVFRLDTERVYREEAAPCTLACPLGLRQREYHDLLRNDRLEEALALLAALHPMPAITGRLCPHPCEKHCSRNHVDEPVNINALEQYLGDRLLDAAEALAAALSAPSAKVAVIGSGPAGLAAAYFLTLAGFAVTVFEKDQAFGGELRQAVPAFRLPDAVLDRQIDFYRRMGVEFRSGVQVGRDLTVAALREQGYDAFLAATGAARSLVLAVPGGDAAGVIGALTFLQGVKTGGIAELRGSVAVIGGGSVAVDAARTALRLGAHRVDLICLERLEPGLKDSMLALTDEIEAAQAEGVVIHPARGVESFTTEEGRATAVRLVECLSVRDEDGRFSPVYGDCVLPESIEAGTVVVAIGQGVDAGLIPDGFPAAGRGLASADAATGWLGGDLFAAGDVATGPATVVEALAAGKRAALAIERYLTTGDPRPVQTPGELPPVAQPPKDKVLAADRVERREQPVAERACDFRETVLLFDRWQAQFEAERCLTCGSRSLIAYLDDCQVCRLCQKYCPTDAIEVTEGAMLGALHTWDVIRLGTSEGGEA
jgi:NADPH-dependent glutamate synthase beta subunit-like oxidoreductase